MANTLPGKELKSLTAGVYIPDHLLEEFKTSFAGLIRRATKLDLPAPNYHIEGKSLLVPFDKISEPFDLLELEYQEDPNSREVRKLVQVHKVNIDATVASISGWSIIATLSYKASNSKPNITVVPTWEWVAKKYQNAMPWCGHCESKRSRQITYVLQHDNHDLIQVGTSCLGDFLGENNKTKLASWQQYWDTLSFLTKSPLYAGKTNHTTSLPVPQGVATLQYHYKYTLNEILNLSAAVIRVYGWLSKTQASSQTGVVPTAQIISDYLMAPSQAEQLAILPGGILPSDLQDAKQAIETVNNFTSYHENDYVANLKKTFSQPIVDFYQVGLISSAINWSKQLLTKSQQRQETIQASNFVGEVGEHLELELTLDAILGPFESNAPWAQSGKSISYLHRFLDDNNNVFIWFTSSSMDNNKKGQRLPIKATVKKHEIRNNVKETVLLRVRIQKQELSQVGIA